MNTKFQLLRLIISFFLILLLSSCIGNSRPAPSSSPYVTQTATIFVLNMAFITDTPTIIPTSTPNLLPTLTSTILPTPDICNPSQWKEEGIYILSPRQFDALSPGGPNTFDRILISQNPSWEGFLQEIKEMDGELWTAGQIFDSYGWGSRLGKGVNPAVLLITYGVERNWELPTYGALVAKVVQIRTLLNRYESEWFRGEVDQSQYPAINNGASYALYRYYDGNQEKLEMWCRTYVDIFGESPIKEFDY